MKVDELTSQLMEEIEPDLLDFIRTKVTSFIKWDLIRFLCKNPNTADTAERLARFAGRSPDAVRPELEEMVQQGLLEVRIIAGIPIYSLSRDKEMRMMVEKFIKACEDRQFRVKVVYHIMRNLAETKEGS
ncbi:MAG: hypothetical protein DRI61_01505 [Chloroflexi bacterium]|nr:MAG: hypothetical protein DRI61_01505 [Chloroflexota bacterium]